MIENAVSYLLIRNASKGQEASGIFYAALLNGMRKISTTSIGTLGINVTDRVNLYINPYFWNSNTLTEQVALLEHELRHVMYDHISRWKELFPETAERMKDVSTKDVNVLDNINDQVLFKTANIAADLAINEYLPDLPKNIKIFDKNGVVVLDKEGNPVQGKACFVEDMQEQAKREGSSEVWERRQNQEYYLAKLLKEMPHITMEMLDDHSLWLKGDTSAKEVKERIKALVGEAAAYARNAGSLTADIELAIHQLNHKPKNWKKDLRNFTTYCSEVVAESSRKVRNRRYRLLYPGIKKYPKLHLGAAVDVSGSMMTEPFIHQMFAELAKIASENVKITVIVFDAEVKSVFEFDPKKKITINGGGGTCFQPALDKASELELDGLIFMTDGENFDDIKKPRYPVLWAIFEGFSPPKVNWGRRTTITLNKKS